MTLKELAERCPGTPEWVVMALFDQLNCYEEVKEGAQRAAQVQIPNFSQSGNRSDDDGTGMSSKEQRSAAQVVKLFSALGRPVKQIQPQAPPRPDVRVVEISGNRIAIETTDFHSDEGNRGGSALRKQEMQHAAKGQIYGCAVPLDPLPGLVSRIDKKASKSYVLTGADECWLVIFAGVPQLGAVVSTFLFSMALDCQKLTTRTASSLQNSQFDQCHIFCMRAATGPCLYSWQRGSPWREVPLLGRRMDSELSPTFWDVQKFLYNYNGSSPKRLGDFQLFQSSGSIHVSTLSRRHSSSRNP